jgi:hypothetical protein
LTPDLLSVRKKSDASRWPSRRVLKLSPASRRKTVEQQDVQRWLSGYHLAATIPLTAPHRRVPHPIINGRPTGHDQLALPRAS